MNSEHIIMLHVSPVIRIFHVVDGLGYRYLDTALMQLDAVARLSLTTTKFAANVLSSKKDGDAYEEWQRQRH